MKKKIALVLALVVTMGAVTGCGCGKKKDTSKKKEENKPVVKVNKEKEVVKDREIEGIKLTNTSVVTTDGVSDVTITVTNPTKEDYQLDEYRINVKDKNGDTIIVLPGYIGEVLKAGESRTIRSSVSMDLSNAKSMEIEVKK